MRSRLFYSLLTIFLCGFFDYSFAYEHDIKNQKYSTQYYKCIDDPQSTTVSIIECNQNEIEIIEKRINNSLKLIKDNIDQSKYISSGQEKFISEIDKSQDLWASEVLLFCRLYSYLDGTINRIVASGCMLDRYYDREKEINSLYNYLQDYQN